MTGRVLAVGESDATASAGVQADVKTILALGGYATTAVSTLQAGGDAAAPVPPSFIVSQMRAATAAIGVDAYKVGFLPDEAAINAVGDVLDAAQHSGAPVVVDPSIIARTGCVLVDEKAIAAWKRRLYVRATVLTPNLREAEILTGMQIREVADMRHAASMMRTLGVEHVVLKVGQSISDKAAYFVASEGQEVVHERPMISSVNTLGAGCTLSAAIAISLAQNLDVHAAVARALDFVHEAILSAAPLGGGAAAGPVNHAFELARRDAVFHGAQAR